MNTLTTEYKNEYRIIGMRRCGQHAIANWIIRQSRGNTWYINDIDPNHSVIELSSLFDPFGEWFRDGTEIKQAPDGPITSLVYNHEDWRLDKIASFEQKLDHDELIGKAEKRYDVLVVRDPCNLFASRYYFRSGMPPGAKRWKWDDTELWKNHAREYLGETTTLSNCKVLLNFNRWSADPGYREEIAGQLGLAFTDQGASDVWHIGSTFDVKKFDGQAGRMDVTGRWKYAAKLPEYLEIFRDAAVLDMTQKIYGETAAIKYLRQVLASRQGV